jgi:transposase
VVLDRAGWHVSGRVEVPEGVRLVFLPPYSPELQPVERVWPLVNEAVANRYFHDLEEMMEVVAERCRVLENARRPSGGTPSSTGGLGRGTQHKRV